MGLGGWFSWLSDEIAFLKALLKGEKDEEARKLIEERIKVLEEKKEA